MGVDIEYAGVSTTVSANPAQVIKAFYFQLHNAIVSTVLSPMSSPFLR